MKIFRSIVLTVIFIMNGSTCFAIPVNTLEEGNNAAGFMLGSKSSNYYLESKFDEAFTIGIQATNWERGYNITDLYGQFNFPEVDNMRGIIGTKSLDSSSRAYLGVAVDKELSPEWIGYTLGTVGRGFQELQIGVNYKINEKNYLNFTYLFLNYKGGRNDLDVGLTYRF